MKQIRKKRGARAGLAILLMLVLIFSLAIPIRAADAASREEYVYVGGMPFGVRYMTDGVMIVGFCDVMTEAGMKNPAKSAGIRPGDCILSVCGTAVRTAAAVAAAVRQNGDKPLTLTVRRDGGEREFTVTPVICRSDGTARTGLWVRDTGAGLGTVTFVMSDQHTFAGLGHGICDGESALLVPIARGSVLDVTIAGITRGAPGAPGELKGHFGAEKRGVLQGNTVCGVYGSFTDAPVLGERMPIGKAEELKEGEAMLRTTLDATGVGEYRVQISDIRRTATGNKCFTVSVTDKTLLQKTGGIVQGMSGSPIIQDGKIVGAVTHVLIGDPTTGYGIFIENMLANIPKAAG